MKIEKIKQTIYPFVPARVNQLEKWLSYQAANGWKLEQKKGWKFTFRKCRPYTTKYFCYASLDRSFGITTEYLISKRRYERAQTSIKESDISIYEVDISKMDEDFSRFVSLRNKEYLTLYLAYLFVSAIIVVACMMSEVEAILFFGFCWLPMVLYSIVSVVLLLFQR